MVCKCETKRANNKNLINVNEKNEEKKIPKLWYEWKNKPLIYNKIWKYENIIITTVLITQKLNKKNGKHVRTNKRAKWIIIVNGLVLFIDLDLYMN